MSGLLDERFGQMNASALADGGMAARKAAQGGGGNEIEVISTSVGSNTFNNAGSGTITKPAGTLDGMLLLYFSCVSDEHESNDLVISENVWTRGTALDVIENTGDDYRFVLYYRWASTEPASYTITHSNINTRYCPHIMVALSGVDAST